MGLQNDFPQSSLPQTADSGVSIITEVIPYTRENSDELKFLVIGCSSAKDTKRISNAIDSVSQENKGTPLSKDTVDSILSEFKKGKDETYILDILADSAEDFEHAINTLVDLHDDIDTPQDAFSWLNERGYNLPELQQNEPEAPSNI